ncbi:MAG: hypothetical protein KGJ79_09725 [Alphaproteobacteria bacterium]|nr:hypothetical protein [Alphaproteobacteria bacterium]MDE2495538.1 hypothetical protein [Alphaproteobacteria bacterium]
MDIRAPSIQWPTALTGAGPDEDPSIMLTGTAKIAGVDFLVSALRMRDGMRIPDYREDVPEKIYETALDNMLDDVEDLVSSMEPELLAINGGRYLLWMVPAAQN